MTYPAELVEETKNFWKYKMTEPCLGQVYIPKVKGQKAPLTIGIHVEQKED